MPAKSFANKQPEKCNETLCGKQTKLNATFFDGVLYSVGCLLQIEYIKVDIAFRRTWYVFYMGH